MHISKLLEGKDHSIITITEGNTIREACETLATKNIGAILVMTSEDDIAGILSERDIVRVLNSHGADVLDANVADHMTRSVVTCSEEDTVDDVMGKMTAGRFRHMPVVKDNKLIGIISIGDVVKQKIALAEQEAEQIKSYITMS